MIVAVIKTPSGATVRIDDSCAVPRESERGKRIIEEQRRVAHDILLRYAERTAAREAATAQYGGCGGHPEGQADRAGLRAR